MVASFPARTRARGGAILLGGVEGRSRRDEGRRRQPGLRRQGGVAEGADARRPAGARREQGGTVYSPKAGKAFPADLALTADGRLELKVRAGLLSRTDYWTR